MDTNRKRLNWDDYFMGFAKHASLRSDCIRMQVGVVIVNTLNRVVGTGYNNTPRGVKSCLEHGECYRIKHNIPSGTQYETCKSIHAEQNAIMQAGENKCVGSTMYIYGHKYICDMCKRFIKNVNIGKIYLQLNENSAIEQVDSGLWLFI